MVKEVVMDITVVSRSFPQILPPQIYRENILGNYLGGLESR